MTTSRSPRHAGAAALTLAAVLTLAACGGDDPSSIAPPPSVDPAETQPEETLPAEEPTEAEAPTQETEAPTQETEEPTEAEAPTQETEEPTSEGADPGAATSGELPQVDITWPADWVDLTESLAASLPPGLEAEAAGVPNPQGFTTNGVVVSYPAGSVPAGGSYDELLRDGQGVDPSTLEPMPEVEIDGHTATVYSSDASQQGIDYRQHLYGIVLEDGSVVEIVFSAGVDGFAEGEAQFQQALGTVVIDG